MRAHCHLWAPGISSLCSSRKCQCHVNGFYFCLIMLRAEKPRVSMAGCSVAVSQCLTGGFVLSLSGCSDWKEGYGRGWGLGGRAGTANSVNPPWILAFSSILPPFPLSSSSFLRCIVSLASFYPRHRQSWTRGQLGAVPKLACHSWPIRECHGGHLTQWLSMNGENKILKRESGALLKRLSVFFSLFFCV